MTDEEIIGQLRMCLPAKPSEIAYILEGFLDGELTQSGLIVYFKRAFPSIPLRTMIEASGWVGVCSDGFSDVEFDAILLSYIFNKRDL